MQITTLVLILLATLINFIDGIGGVIGGFTGSYFPASLSITIVSIEVFLLFLATVFSFINCFTNKTTKKLQKFLLLAVSSALFFANLNWLITWILPVQ